jgi:hypothetical protein
MPLLCLLSLPFNRPFKLLFIASENENYEGKGSGVLIEHLGQYCLPYSSTLPIFEI